jgi:DNA polymerase-3 subunit delta
MIHALDVLANRNAKPAPFVAVFGDDRFLQLEVIQHLAMLWIGAGASEFGLTRLDGQEARWADVFDLLSTGSLFSSSGRRMVVLDPADEFVKAHRGELEQQVEKSGANTLILCVESWPANTRLYKQIEKIGLQIDCHAPTVARGKSKQLDEGRVIEWLVNRARTTYSFELSKSAARQLMDLSDLSFGLFDQQLAKLSCYAADTKSITPDNVRDWIGGWRIKTVWQTIDAAVDGETAKALELLKQLLQSGEHPLALFGQISWSLRRYGEALELYDRGQREGNRPRLSECLAPAGFRPWGGELAAAENRLKRLGPHRARKILRWLLEADLALKGSHSHESRGQFVLEQLIARLALPPISAAAR